MQQAATRKDVVVPQSVVTPKIAVARLLIGLLQGAVLYFLYRAAKANAWPATEEYLFAPLLLVCVLAPVILISSLGHRHLDPGGGDHHRGNGVLRHLARWRRLPFRER